jgi:hypothetical protein
MARLGYSKAFAYVFFGFGSLALAISDERPENAIRSAQHGLIVVSAPRQDRKSGRRSRLRALPEAYEER